MEPVIIHTLCPACGAETIYKSLSAKDYMISQLEFEIWECGQCFLRFTQAVPGEQAIGKYYKSEAYVSHTDTQKGLVNRLYHMVRKRTLKKKYQLVNSMPRTGMELLDVGAGTGAFAAYMHEQGWNVNGVETDADARKKAADLYGLSLFSAEGFFKLPAESFNVITLWHVLEHVHRLHEYLGQLNKLLTQNGTLIIAVPNYTSYDAGHYKQYWAAYDVPRHLYHFSPGAMESLLNKHGLKLTGTQPMWFDSFYVSLLSEKYKTGKSNLLKGFWNGMISNRKAMKDKERCSSLIYIINK